MYPAAAEERRSGAAEDLGLDTLILKKGNYASLTIDDYAKDIPSIDRAFQELLALPGIDAQGYCVECYVTEKDVLCMVRMKG